MNKYKNINFRILEEWDAKLAVLAKEEGCAKSYLIRKIIKNYLKQVEKTKDNALD